MAEKKKPKRILLKQLAMRRMLLALSPSVAGAVYFFGWRSLAVVLVAAIVGFLTELIFTRLRGEPVSEAVFVTTTIYALIMPPTVPWHVVVIGVVFAVMFVKEIFGGFGRNIFNPAMAGRCFVYIAFPIAMTAVWAPPAEGVLGALDRWTTAPTEDALTSATPMAYLKLGRMELAFDEEASTEVPYEIPEEENVPVKTISFWLSQLLGRISGTMGVTSALLSLIGGIYIYYTKTASRTIILWLIGTYAVLNQVLYWAGVEPVPMAPTAVLGGGFLFGAFFIATDPVSAARTETGRKIYAMIIGTCTVVIRNFSIFNGGLMFSILIGNMFAPIIDHAVRTRAASKKAKAAAAGVT
jgi:Na+-transporting NADH:ubiquinone oxidoreductase subunit B